jgi:hypothetical protein
MAYEEGQQLLVTGPVADMFSAEEVVTVVHVDEDGVPVVEIPPDGDRAGRVMRVPEELQESFEPA